MVSAHRGYAISESDEMIAATDFHIAEYPILRRLVVDQRPVVASASQGGKGWENLLSSAPAKSYIGCPIIYGKEVIGFLNLASVTSEFYSPTHTEILKVFSHHAAIALRNAQVFEQAQELAILEERQRLARDLHDSVSQSLFSASIVAESLTSTWEKDPESVVPNLRNLHSMILGATAEMRTLLVELRPSSIIDVSFDSLIERLSDAYRGRGSAAVSVNISGSRTLPPDVQIVMYRIAQEALNNVVKHAGADQVSIELFMDMEEVNLCVRDNGCGFDPSHIPPDHFGIKIMAERARGVDAKLTINSQQGAGTEVTVIWLNRSEQA